MNVRALAAAVALGILAARGWNVARLLSLHDPSTPQQWMEWAAGELTS